MSTPQFNYDVSPDASDSEVLGRNFPKPDEAPRRTEGQNSLRPTQVSARIVQSQPASAVEDRKPVSVVESVQVVSKSDTPIAIAADEMNSKTLKNSIKAWLKANSTSNSVADFGDDNEGSNGMIRVGVPEDKTLSIHFVTNWLEMWKSERLDPSDDFGLIAPLFRTCTEFYGHRNALIALAIFVMYFMIVKFVVISIDPRDSGANSLSVVGSIMVYLLFIFAMSVYKGSLGERRLMRTKRQAENDFREYQESLVKGVQFHPALQITDDTTDVEDPTIYQLFKNMVRAIVKEAYHSVVCVQARNTLSLLRVPCSKIPGNGCGRVAKILPSYQPTTEDLIVRAQDPGLRKPNFYVLLNMGVKCINKIGTPYYPPEGFRPFLIGLLCAIPMAFGAIYASMWYQIVVVMGCFDPVYGPYEGYTQIMCDATIVEISMSLGYFTHWLMWSTVGNACAVTLFGLVYGADIAHSLAKTWFDRFVTLRRMQPPVTDISDMMKTEEDESLNARKEFSDLDRMLHIMPYVKRDAYERYIYIHEIMLAFGKRWRTLLSCLLAATGAQIIYGFYLLFSVSLDVYLAVSMAGCIVLFLFPVYCLAYTNSAVDTIFNGFSYAAPEDYQALGGRDTWLTFITQAPLYWHIFGFAITRTWLTGIMCSIVLAAIVTIGNTYLTAASETAASTSTGQE
jgi:hypothetical protein